MQEVYYVKPVETGFIARVLARFIALSISDDDFNHRFGHELSC